MAKIPAIDQYIHENNGNVFQTIINNDKVDKELKRQVRQLAVSSPQMLSTMNEMLKTSGDVKQAIALVRDATDLLAGKEASSVLFTDAGDDPMFPGKGERELRKAVALPFLVIATVALLIIFL
ncbi:hypothetical protein ACF1BK_06190 [Streptomyces globisporus]|uniref:hypothetical protein n=1 Tax=Streptomyces globisporus TaxID=1908 RepID=UPI003700DECF